MIFRRIKAHIAKEDWFAVFIDFIIVVFGVYMGFQVQLALLNNTSCYEVCPPEKVRKKFCFPNINAVFPRIDPCDDLTGGFAG